jgi:hypothetical protein
MLFLIGCDFTFHKQNTVNMAGEILLKNPQKLYQFAYSHRPEQNKHQRYDNVLLCSF